jgi:hypothetical protein
MLTLNLSFNLVSLNSYRALLWIQMCLADVPLERLHPVEWVDVVETVVLHPVDAMIALEPTIKVSPLRWQAPRLPWTPQHK